MRLDTDVGDRLDRHTSDVQGTRTCRSLPDIAVNSDALDFGDVLEGDGFAEETEDVTASWATEGSVLMVRRAVVPGS